MDHVLALMYLNGHRITFKDQTFYKREQSFIRAMNELIRQRIIKKGCDGFHDEYMLTKEGMIYASKVVLA